MAVIKQTSDYAFIDELLFYDSIYASCSWEMSPCLYQIEGPFRMDSEVDALQRNAPSRKRKRKAGKSVSDRWLKICNKVKRLYEAVLHDISAFTRALDPDDLRNTAAKKSASAADGILLENLGFYVANRADSSICEVILDKSVNKVDKGISECTLWSNLIGETVSIVCGTEEFIVPPECSFIIGDVRLSRHLLFRDSKFDLIVLDPPWKNKSVKRRAVYDMFDEKILFEIPLKDLLNINGIVVLWLTNSAHVHTVANNFLKHHSLRRLAVWYWLKVTRSGETVCKFRPEHKVPFESMIIACDQSAVYSEHSFHNEFVLISTPSAVHSRKPPIANLLSSLNVFTSKKTLELFGRYLLPLTTTIGFEAIKLQNTRFFRHIK